MEYTATIRLQHETTEAEQRILVELILFLKRIGFSGEINCRCFLVNQDGKARRPDIYLPRYALPIEIDGKTRDWQHRQDDIAPRDAFYESIGARPPLVIPANWVVSEHKMNRLKYDLAQFLYQSRLSPRKRNTINKRICDGRKMFEAIFPGVFDGTGSVAPKFSHELADFKEYRHFGGTKFILRSKYQQRSNFFPGLADLLTDPEKFTKMMMDRVAQTEAEKAKAAIKLEKPASS
jgi:hypothetical protein